MICLIQKNNSCGLQVMNRMQGNLSYRYTGRVSLLKAAVERPIVQEIDLNRLDPLQVFSELCLFIHHREEMAGKKHYCIMGSETRKNSRRCLNGAIYGKCNSWLFPIFLVCQSQRTECLFKVTFFQTESFFRFISKPLGFRVNI